MFFVVAEKQLKENLQRTNTYDVYITEQLSGAEANTFAQQTLSEETMWNKRFGSDKITYLRQSFSSASLDNKEYASVFVYGPTVTELNRLNPKLEAPTIWLLKENPTTEYEYVTVRERRLLAKVRKLDPKLSKLFKKKDLVLIPASMSAPFITGGFINHILAEFDNSEDVHAFSKETAAFYAAQKRYPRTFSATGILDSLEQLQKAQIQIRLAIIASCGVILALTLGTIAWLEYRQEAYLLALLRSFGTPKLILLAHSFLENLVLVTSGMLLALQCWKPLYTLLQRNVKELGLNSMGALTLPTADTSIILISGAVGVLFAMIPVAVGLRKPTGLTLQ